MIHPLKGRKLTEEHKKKISLALIGTKQSETHRMKNRLSHLGIKFSEQTREKLRILGKRPNSGQFKKGQKPIYTPPKGRHPWNYGLKGVQAKENHPNWKGGITPERVRLWKSDQYIFWRNSVFQRDKFTCQICNEIGRKLEAHHINRCVKFLV